MRVVGLRSVLVAVIFGALFGYCMILVPFVSDRSVLLRVALVGFCAFIVLNAVSMLAGHRRWTIESTHAVLPSDDHIRHPFRTRRVSLAGLTDVRVCGGARSGYRLEVVRGGRAVARPTFPVFTSGRDLRRAAGAMVFAAERLAGPERDSEGRTTPEPGATPP